MKLDLNNFGELALIAVSEAVSAENVPVIMAGIRKLKEANPPVILLDLSTSDPATGAVSALRAVRSHPGYSGLGIKMISPQPDISDFVDLKIALASLKIKIAPKVLEWQKLNSEVVSLRAKEKEANDKMGGRSLSEDMFIKAVAKNKALKKFNTILAPQIDGILKTLRGLQMESKDFQETLTRYEAVRTPFQEALKTKGIVS